LASLAFEIVLWPKDLFEVIGVASTCCDFPNFELADEFGYKATLYCREDIKIK